MHLLMLINSLKALLSTLTVSLVYICIIVIGPWEGTNQLPANVHVCGLDFIPYVPCSHGQSVDYFLYYCFCLWLVTFSFWWLPNQQWTWHLTAYLSQDLVELGSLSVYYGEYHVKLMMLLKPVIPPRGLLYQNHNTVVGSL